MIQLYTNTIHQSYHIGSERSHNDYEDWKGMGEGGGIEHSFEKKIKDTLILKSMKLVRIMPASWKNFKFYLLVHQNLRDHRETTNVCIGEVKLCMRIYIVNII